MESSDSFETWLCRARAEFPAAVVPDAAFRDALEARLRDTPESTSAALHGLDLYLAVGCALGDPGALAAFETMHVARIPSWLGESDRQIVDEVRQRVRDRVLVGTPEAPPRIAGYSARGPLGAWLRVVALREHARLRRAASRERVDDIDQLDELTRSAELTPELALLKAKYQPLVRDAFRGALSALTPRARTLLRLCYLDAIALDAIGTMYGVNKSTVSRWIAATRIEILEHVRVHVAGALRTSDDEVASVLHLVRSQIELSLGLLIEHADPAIP
ncbi:MAG: hypothetical protein IPQ07_29485 [Myxococcales bacterium]|nr:hypothetical protein [Myxococcales bacterium]